MAVIDGRQVDADQYLNARVIEVVHLDDCEAGCVSTHPAPGTPYSTGGTLPVPPKGSLEEAILRLKSAPHDEQTIAATTWGSTNPNA